MSDRFPQADAHEPMDEDYDEGMSFPEFLAQQEKQEDKLPRPDKIFLTLAEAATVLEMSPYKLRTAITKGQIRSKRLTKSRRARFMIHREWLDEYQRFLNAPTLSMRIKAWFRRSF